MERRWGDQARFGNKRRQDERELGNWDEREARRVEEDLRAKLRRDQERRKEEPSRRSNEEWKREESLRRDAESGRREVDQNLALKGKRVVDPGREEFPRQDLQRRLELKDGKELCDEELAKKCYKCGKSGHQQVACSNPSLCYACKKSGYISTCCPDLIKGEGLRLCGMGMPGQVFHCMHIEVNEEEVLKQPVVGLLTVENGSCNASKIVDELKYLFEKHQMWD